MNVQHVDGTILVWEKVWGLGRRGLSSVISVLLGFMIQTINLSFVVQILCCFAEVSWKNFGGPCCPSGNVWIGNWISRLFFIVAWRCGPTRRSLSQEAGDGGAPAYCLVERREHLIRMSELAFFRIYVVKLKVARFIGRVDNILFCIDDLIHII